MQNAILLSTITEEEGRQTHKWDYLALLAFLAFLTYVLLFFAKTRQLRFHALTIMVLGYVLWGLIHHTREDTLTWTIMFEYVGLLTFVSILLVVLFFLV